MDIYWLEKSIKELLAKIEEQALEIEDLKERVSKLEQKEEE